MALPLFRCRPGSPSIAAVLAAFSVCLAFASAAEPTNPTPIQLSVSLHDTCVPSFFGLGIQWDPYSYQPREEAWKLTLKRLDNARPAFFRVMMGAQSYCRGFDGVNTNTPLYVWTEGEAEIQKRLGSLLGILDYAQSRNIEVLLGEWSPPGRLGNGSVSISRPDDPRWAQVIADFVSWVREKRGYSVIRMYNMFNEPNGNWMWPQGKVDYQAWASGVRNLRHQFDAHGLKNLPIVGPDNSWDWDWIDRTSREMPELIGEWEMHWYATDKDVFEGKIEKLLAEKRQVVLANDPQAASKRFFMAEGGLLDGKCNGDQQPRVKNFEYGVMMADYVAQVAQAGWMGACAWDLDDAMHTVNGHPEIPDGNTLKVWGFWNTQGKAMGHPEDEAIRPWFYTWSLMSQFFARDARILAVNQPNVPHLRILAGGTEDGRQLSVMVVNNSDEARTVNIMVPGAGKKTLREYHYFDNDRPVDGDGFPVATRAIQQNDLDAGVSVTLPSRGVIFLRTP